MTTSLVTSSAESTVKTWEQGNDGKKYYTASNNTDKMESFYSQMKIYW